MVKRSDNIEFWLRFLFLATVFILIFTGVLSFLDDTIAGIVFLLPVLIISVEMGLAAGVISAFFFLLVAFAGFYLTFSDLSPILGKSIAGGGSYFVAAFIGSRWYKIRSSFKAQKEKVQELEQTLEQEREQRSFVLADEKKRLEELVKRDFSHQQDKILEILAERLIEELSPDIVSVLNQAQLLDSELHNPRHKEIMKSLLVNGNRLSESLNRLTALKDRIEITPSRIELNELVESSLSLFENLPDITLERNTGETYIPFQGDLYWMKNAFFELVENSLDLMKGKGKLSMTTRLVSRSELQADLQDSACFTENWYAFFSISDTGEPLKLLEKDFCLNLINVRNEGFALRLSAVNHIIRSHNGIMKIEKGSLEGNKIEIYLPAEQKQEEEQQDSTTNNAESEFMSGGILVIDDEPLFRDLLLDLLSSYGYKVFSAASGEEGINGFRDKVNSIQMVLVDNIMPDMNGSEVFSRLKDINPDIKGILMSGYEFDEKLRESLDSGFIHFFKKPFAVSSLIQVINLFFKDYFK